MNKVYTRTGGTRLWWEALALAGLGVGTLPTAMAQEQPAAKPAENVEEVVVTGTRIAREAVDASTPLMVVGAEEIKMSGAMSVDKVLSEQPQFVAATYGGA